MAIHIGHRRAGWPGLIVAGVCFIAPAALLVGAIAWAYVQFGALPRSLALLDGVKPVMVAIVAQALGRLAKGVVKSWWLGALLVAAVAAEALGVNELIVLGAGGALVALGRRRGAPVATWLPFGLGAVAPVGALGLWPLFWVFAKVGSVLFGSGYVLLAFLRADLVERLHWLTNSQLLDAVAVGQVTPGPVFTTATFVGYLLRGAPGALVATAGIFRPAFIFVALSGPLVPRLRRSPVAGAFLDGVNVASVALMAVVTWQLGRTAIVDWKTVALALISLGLVTRTRVNPVWLVLGGGVAGLLL
jgi:chromate transporter